MAEAEAPPWVLAAILGQVLATSVWFAPNAGMGEQQGLWLGRRLATGPSPL